MRSIVNVVSLAVVVYVWGCSGDGSPAMESTGGASGTAGAVNGVAGSAGSFPAAGTVGVESGGSAAGASSTAGAAAAGKSSGGAEPTAGATAGGISGGCQVSSGGCGGVGSSPNLKRVLVYDQVDVNPDTGMLRGHTGGGEDENLLNNLGAEHGFEVVVTDQASDFNAANLARFEVVAFASPDYATQALTAKNRADLEAFVRGGGGWIGWHYALWVEKGWPFLAVLGGGVSVKAHVGAEQASTYTVVDATHPVARGLPKTFDVQDDFLAFNSGSPADDPSVTILATAALTAPPGGDGHPVIWVHPVDKGRAFYSMLGHSAADFKTPFAKTLIWNALRWVSRSN